MTPLFYSAGDCTSRLEQLQSLGRVGAAMLEDAVQAPSAHRRRVTWSCRGEHDRVHLFEGSCASSTRAAGNDTP